jgi:hypothetical protein
MTGSSWKKHWVVCDGHTVSQFHSRIKPPSNEKAKYVLPLANCMVEDSHIRKFCFKIEEASSKTALVLAADDFETYEQWLKLLTNRGERSPPVEDNNASPQENEPTDADYVERSEASFEEKDDSGDITSSPVDVVLRFFQHYDRCSVRPMPLVLQQVWSLEFDIFNCFFLCRISTIHAWRSSDCQNCSICRTRL